jgi:hypothetical protein
MSLFKDPFINYKAGKIQAVLREGLSGWQVYLTWTSQNGYSEHVLLLMFGL